MLSNRQKKLAINASKIHETDTGSAGVQIALLSKSIAELTEHLKKNPKDNHSRRGLLQMVGKRRRFLAYLLKTNPKAHSSLVKKLDL
jgi:small subunit ribosomal protein S15